MKITLQDLSKLNLTKNHKISGWIDSVRKHKNITFFNLRDHTATIQCITSIKDSTNYREESYIEILGQLIIRKDNYIKANEINGHLEFKVIKVTYLSLAEVSLNSHTVITSNLSTKLAYRYIDLRNPYSRSLIIKRSQVIQLIHKILTKRGFHYVETPLLIKSTPEGAKDLLALSSKKPGCAYALPQSPQLFKQILMIGGIEKYYQIAKCVRDEDIRSDRQLEFTQLDLECITNSTKDIQKIISQLVKKIFLLNFDKNQIFDLGYLTYDNAIKKYGCDKPDLSIEGLLLEHDNHNNWWLECTITNYENYLNDEITYEDGKFKAKGTKGREALALLRNLLGYNLGKKKPGIYMAWLIDIPMFGFNDDHKLVTNHNPFTKIKFNNRRKFIDEFNHPEKLMSYSFDLIINGYEVGGGALRETDTQVLAQTFSAIGYDKSQITNQFDFFFKALNSGAPMHGGIALGLDRLMMLLMNESDMRNTIAFPKNQSGTCYLTQAPSLLSPKELSDLKISVIEDVFP